MILLQNSCHCVLIETKVILPSRDFDEKLFAFEVLQFLLGSSVVNKFVGGSDIHWNEGQPDNMSLSEVFTECSVIRVISSLAPFIAVFHFPALHAVEFGSWIIAEVARFLQWNIPFFD